MKKSMKIMAAFVLALVVLLSHMTAAASESTSYTYTVSVDGEWIRTQDAYMPGSILLYDQSLSAPEDLFFYEGRMYIADKAPEGGGRIVVYDRKEGIVGTLGEGLLLSPTGLFVNEDAVFVADREAGAVYKLSHDGDVLMTLGRPDSYLFSSQSHYLPTGVAVTSQGVIFVCGEGAYEGLMQFDRNGVFQGYFAANSTKGLTFMEQVQELVFNEEQLSSLMNRIPNPITNIDMSEQDLIYSVTQLEATTLWSVASYTENAVKYHNMAGRDIIGAPIAGEHNFADVAAGPDGRCYAVTTTGIIYEYDDSGNVVFSFGGLATSDRSGHFTYASAIELDEEGNLYVLDKERACVQVFFPTEFAQLTHQALYNLNHGYYAESEAAWMELLSRNGMSWLAHMGYGKVLYQQLRFEEAAEQFRIIGDQANYSECMWEIRNIWFQRNLPGLLAVVIALTMLSALRRFLKKKGWLKARTKKTLPLLLHIKRHASCLKGMLKNPFDEFYYLKKRQHGSPASATVLFLLAFALYLCDMLARGFAFRLLDPSRTSPVSVVVLFVVPAFLWVAGNFLVSSINEGEGSLANVYMATAYSLTPYIVIGPLVIISTYVLTLNEAVIVHYLWAIALLWSVGLLCMSVREIHGYTVKETVKIILLTLFFMMMAVIVCVILYLIGQQVVIFFGDFINEVIYHVKS